MNNNDLNNQYNGMNNQNNFNNQPINNNMNNQFNNNFQNNNNLNANYNNGFNNNNNINQNNGYNANTMVQGGAPKKSFDVKTIVIIVGIVVAGLFFGSKLLGNNNDNNSNSGSTGNSLFGGHKNTTGSSEYKDSDVDLNCTLDSSNEKANKKLYTDVIYNYKNYQAVMYNKIVIEDENGWTDDEYQELIVEFGGTKCMFVGECTGDHIEIGLSALGFDTVIDRNVNKVEVTYYKTIGSGATATKEDMKTFEKSLENDGMVCN